MKKIWNSLRGKVLINLLIFTIPFILLLLGVSSYSARLIEERIYSNNSEVLQLNLNVLDMELNSSRSWLNSEVFRNKINSDFKSNSRKKKYAGSMEVASEIQQNILLYKNVEGILCYSPNNQNLVYTFSKSSPSFNSRQRVMSYVKNNLERLAGNGGKWISCKVEEEYYLICVLGYNGVYYGMWTSYTSLSQLIEGRVMDDESFWVFASKEGELYSSSNGKDFPEIDFGGSQNGYYYAGERKQYLVTGSASAAGDFYLAVVDNREHLLGIFLVIRHLTILITLVGIIFGVPVLIHTLNISVFWPIARLEEGIRRIEEGDLTGQIENNHSSTEMASLINSFNGMSKQLQDLKLQVYEDKIEHQKQEIDYMQLQLKPHFYLNALNLINMMAQVGDTELIQELTVTLAEYMRFLINARKQSVTLEEELLHVNHYFKIMEIRFGDSFQVNQQVDNTILNVEIPPLTIQMLVENSLKYAFKINSSTIINIIAERIEEGIRICVQDDGKGYSEEVLRRFSNNEMPRENHIGLWNLRQRLRYMFGDQAIIMLSNRIPQGANSEITIKGTQIGR